MRHFLQLASNVNTLPTLNALAANEALWNANTLRTKHPHTAHAEADDIWLWFNELPKDGDNASVVDDREVVEYPAWRALPQVRSIVFGLLAQVEGIRLGRTMITRLAPGKRILPHVDGGAPATYFSRYQVALQSLPGAIFRIEDEEVNFRTGDVWRINNRAEHSVDNASASDRIVLIADIRSA